MAMLLVLNLTVAIGICTLNGIVFHANIMYSNNSVLLPFTEPINLCVCVCVCNI